ncbi:hypothetical protein MRX96_049684 [Rhipicephalus microplus]
MLPLGATWTTPITRIRLCFKRKASNCHTSATSRIHPGGTLAVFSECSARGRVTSSQQQLINAPPHPEFFSGHGGSVAATMFNRNIFFLAQIFSIAITGHAPPWSHVDHPDNPYPTLLQEESEQLSHFCHITDPPGGTLAVFSECSARGRVTSSQQQLINAPPHPKLFSGHGGSVAATMFNRNIFFLAQVSRMPEAKPFRSNDVCLLLLPCPIGNQVRLNDTITHRPTADMEHKRCTLEITLFTASHVAINSVNRLSGILKIERRQDIELHRTKCA